MYRWCCGKVWESAWCLDPVRCCGSATDGARRRRTRVLPIKEDGLMHLAATVPYAIILDSGAESSVSLRFRLSRAAGAAELQDNNARYGHCHPWNAAWALCLASSALRRPALVPDVCLVRLRLCSLHSLHCCSCTTIQCAPIVCPLHVLPACHCIVDCRTHPLA